MSDLILDSMIEARNAMEWEELNREPEVDMDEAAGLLGDALDDISIVFKDLGEAAAAVKGHPMEDRILSLFKDLELVQDDMVSMKARIEEVKR